MVKKMFLEKGDRITLIITLDEMDGKQVISVLVDRLPALNPNILGASELPWAKKTELVETPPVKPAGAELPVVGV